MSSYILCEIFSDRRLCDLQGYLPDDLQDEAVNRVKRQLAGCIEMLTKQLEQLDGLSLADSTEELKSRRKTTVRRIQVR